MSADLRGAQLRGADLLNAIVTYAQVSPENFVIIKEAKERELSSIRISNDW